ncbi:unnamed protein product [Kuraishia capsulata CBS 1993]|uniref:Oligomycin resistance ATP-dependent permease YOR1 n=1 Tax=Kuraishia capsulata CBS 1993 TaxID=1382522 RepID=W6MHP4_9ASCO|nr:uncharacterized protein KUCA_T00001270001 [Kuraishia capsulata CBS 1993]CDK25303.1 unnamed protein product [Kuraishia capsulata CBS 1993]
MSEPPRQKRILSWALSKKVPPITQEEDRLEYPFKRANILSKIFFSWLDPLLHKGYRRTLEPEDLWYLTDELKLEHYYSVFLAQFEPDLAARREAHLEAKCKARGETFETSTVTEDEDLADFVYPWPKFGLILLKTFFRQYVGACVLKTIGDLASTTAPLLQKALINYVTKRAKGLEPNVGTGVGYAIGCALFVTLEGLMVNHYFYHAMVTGSQVKAILTKFMLEKSFRQTGRSRHDFPTGKVNSIMGTDLARIDFAIGFLPFLFCFPVPAIVSIVLLIINIGPSSLVGIAIFFLALIALGSTIKRLMFFRLRANKFTDGRVNLVKELLKNFKMIKYYSWEPSYVKNIEETRTAEMHNVFLMQIMRNIMVAFAIALPTVCSMISFLVLYGINSSRSVADIFSSLTLFQVLAMQLIMVPLALASGSDALIGIRRVLEFVCSGDIDEEDSQVELSLIKEKMESSGSVLRVVNASFEWETFDADEEDIASTNESVSENERKPDPSLEGLESTSFPGLNNINLDIRKGEFVVVTGLIGSGKSSLLYALSGFMHRTQGHVATIGDLLLCGNPWIQNATVKDNISFGMPFDQQKYDNVIHACSLEADLDLLPAGDHTEVGERGITLSGGQKARLNLARAVYADRDIILLDDILSAVDARVGKHIMDECLLGLLKDKTRLLATHQLSLISAADRVIFLNGDGSIDVGTTAELLARNEGFTKLMEFSTQEKNDTTTESGEAAHSGPELEDEKELIRIQTLTKSLAEAESNSDYQHKDADGVLMQLEDRAVNAIELGVYGKYLKLGAGAFGIGIIPLLLGLVACSVFCSLFTNTWLTFWTEKKFDRSNGFFIGIYVMFTMLTIVFMVLEFSLLVYLTNTASRLLNIYAIRRLMHVPMSFMDTTPMGRILNRFTKDTDVLDNELPEQIRLLVHFTGTITGILVLCIIYLPWFAISVPILAFCYIACASYYQASAREVKRIEALQRSFVYSNFNETLQGMEVITAYKAEKRFIARNDALIDKMNEAYYLTFANMRWLSIRIDVLAAVLVLIVSLLCVMRVFHISPASVGLLLSYTLNIAGMMSMLLNVSTQIENEMNSVERLEYYGFRVVQEAPFKISEKTPPPEWPHDGRIQFENVTLCYRQGLPAVLKNLNMDVKGAEKIGICGRTGAGKSSIMTALYRLAEMESGGRILIDDIDISTLGLHDLRSRLSIIPQDPVLFRGSIRGNLDPFHEHKDELLWDALRRSGLIEGSKLDQVKHQTLDDENLHKFHLGQNVEDDGTNFSLGERQLLALARALVRNSKILILDEATSSVDYETDSKIQTTISTEFAGCTIMCIAHRLKTIVNYDRILVLDKGEISEFDKPWALFQDESTIFRQMCNKSGVVAEDFEKQN